MKTFLKNAFPVVALTLVVLYGLKRFMPSIGAKV